METTTRNISKELAKQKVPGTRYNWILMRWRRYVLRLIYRWLWGGGSALMRLIKLPEKRDERVMQEILAMKKGDTKPRRRVQNAQLPKGISRLTKEELVKHLTEFGAPGLEEMTRPEMVDLAYSIPTDVKKGETSLEVTRQSRVRVTATPKAASTSTRTATTTRRAPTNAESGTEIQSSNDDVEIIGMSSDLEEVSSEG